MCVGATLSMRRFPPLAYQAGKQTMTLVEKVPTMSDQHLVNLLANAKRMLAGGTAPQQASASEVITAAEAEGLKLAPFIGISCPGVIDADGSIEKGAQNLPGNWESSFYKGAQYGVPANECFERDALVYNSSMVEKAGLDPKIPPVTWAEVLDWHKKLTKFDSAGNLKQIGIDPYDSIGGSMNPIDGFFAGESWGFTYFDGATSKFDLDNDKMAEIFDTYAEFYKVVGPDKMAGMRSVEGQGTWGGSYFTEVQAMVIDGYWHCQWTEQAKPEVAKVSSYTWGPVTEARRGVKMQYPGGHLICLFKDSKHHTEAFKVAEFLQTKSACDILFDLRGFLPARPAYLKTVNKYTYPGLDFFFNSLDEATEWEKMVPCVIADFVQNQFNTLGESVYRGQMDSKAAVAQMQKACTEEWQKTGLA